MFPPNSSWTSSFVSIILGSSYLVLFFANHIYQPFWMITLEYKVSYSQSKHESAPYPNNTTFQWNQFPNLKSSWMVNDGMVVIPQHCHKFLLMEIHITPSFQSKKHLQMYWIEYLQVLAPQVDFLIDLNFKWSNIY